MQAIEGLLAEVERQEGRSILRLAGEMTLPYAGLLRDRLRQALQDGGSTVLDLAGVTTVDVSGLQLLCSAHRCFGRRGIGLSLWNLPNSFRDSARRAGFFSRGTVCPPHPGRPCLWEAGGAG